MDEHKQIKLLVVDDTPSFYHLLKDWVELSSADCAFSCDFTTGDKISQILPRLKPTVVIIDAHIFERNVIEIIDELKIYLTKVIVISIEKNIATEQSLLERGADKCLFKGESPDELEEIVQQIIELAPEIYDMH